MDDCCAMCENMSPHKSWDLVKYRWNPKWLVEEEPGPAMIDVEIKMTVTDRLSPADIMAIVTNYVNENEPNAARYGWHNTTGDDYDWEYYEGKFEAFSGRSVYAMFPTEQRGFFKK